MGMAVGAVMVLGVFSIVGGLIGFVKARSRASLIAGGFSGLLLLVCAHTIYYQRPQQDAAVLASGVVALSLGVRFFFTWRKTRRLMPDLLMVLLSTLTLVATGASLLEQLAR
jgi:uncharacterized membrane protein (UPF0136 family)